MQVKKFGIDIAIPANSKEMKLIVIISKFDGSENIDEVTKELGTSKPKAMITGRFSVSKKGSWKNNESPFE